MSRSKMIDGDSGRIVNCLLKHCLCIKLIYIFIFCFQTWMDRFEKRTRLRREKMKRKMVTARRIEEMRRLRQVKMRRLEDVITTRSELQEQIGEKLWGLAAVAIFLW